MLKAITKNFRKPKGFIGKMILKKMNSHHSRVTAWGIGLLDISPGLRVLDAGCGGGAAVARMADAGAKVWGIDYSETAVKEAIRNNTSKIEEGSVIIREANVSALPFEDGFFDLVTAFETIYFWPDWNDAFKEIYRVTVTGGRFAIILEMMKDKAARDMLSRDINMRIPDDGELEGILSAVGFSGVKTIKGETKLTYDRCIIAVKQ